MSIKNRLNKSDNTLPLLIGAIAFGIAAALLSVLYLKAKESALLARLKGEEQQMVEVVVANRNLPRGSAVINENFSLLDVPVKYVHSDVVRPGEYERYKGRALTTDLEAGKPLLKSFLDEEFPVDFSDTIPVGHRALTVTVDEVNSVAGLIRPGNHIDIFVNIPYQTSGFDPKLYAAGLFKELPADLKLSGLQSNPQGLLSQLPEDQKADLLNSLDPGDVIIPVVQNVRVLAAGRDPYIESLDHLRQPQFRSDTNFTSVTLDILPNQAALLTAARDKGELLAVLRNRKDPGNSNFTSISTRDLFQNASQMAAAEKERASRAAVADGLSVNGDLVDKDGNKILSRDQLAAAGLTVNENGQLVDKDGNIVDPKDVVIGADGNVMTKQQLAATGLTVNESGQIVDENGNIVSANDIVTAADGTVMTKEQLAAAGLRINENGEIVDSQGRIVSPDDVIIAADGSVMTRQQLADAGLSVNEKGEIVDKDGNVVAPNDILVAADGSILTKEQLAAAGFSINENGEIVDKNGTVIDPKDLIVASDGSIVTRAQLAALGLSINENGQVVDKDGNVVHDLITAPDGTVLSMSQLAAAGLSVNEKGEIVDANGKVVSAKEIARVAKEIPITGTEATPGSYDYIIGGASKDGTPKRQTLPLGE